jgi:hypothetical protein
VAVYDWLSVQEHLGCQDQDLKPKTVWEANGQSSGGVLCCISRHSGDYGHRAEKMYSFICMLR